MPGSQAALEILLKAREDAVRAVRNLDDAMEDLGENTEEVEQKTDRAKRGMDAFQQVLTAGAVIAAGKAAHEMATLGGEVIRTEATFQSISGGISAAETNLEAMRAATRGTMTEMEMMANASKLLQMGLAEDAEGLASITEMATRLGGAMGMDATASMADFSAMLANQSIPRLDQFGISSGRVREQIRELQAANEGMTRETAFMVAVMDEGAAALERLGPAADDAATEIQRTEAEIQNMKNALAADFAPVWAGFLKTLHTGIEELGKGTLRYRQLFGAIGAGAMHLVGADKAAKGFLERLNVLEDQADQTAPPIEDLKNAIRAVPPPPPDAEQGLEGIEGAAEDAQGAVEDFSVSVQDMAADFGEVEWDNWREQAWEMAQGLDLTGAELTSLAKNLGIASDAEITATVRMHNYAEALANGEITVARYQELMGDLAHQQQMANRELANGGVAVGDFDRELKNAEDDIGHFQSAGDEAAVSIADFGQGVQEAESRVGTLAGTAGGLETNLRGASDAAVSAKDDVSKVPGDSIGKFGDLAGSVSDVEGSLRGVAGAAQQAKRDIDSIPTHKTITIETVYRQRGQSEGGYLQHGTDHWGGGFAWVGEAGPEMVWLPPETVVYPHHESLQMASQMRSAGGPSRTVNNRQQYNETVVIQDRAAMAMYLRQHRDRQLRAMAGGG